MTSDQQADLDSNEIYEFEPFRFDAENLLLFRASEPVAATPKALSILAFLIRNRHRVVSKTEIVAEVWAGFTVQGNNLSVQLSALRKALAADEQQPYVETVPRRGYRFVGELRANHPKMRELVTRVDSPTAVSSSRRWGVVAGIGLAVILIVVLAATVWRRRAASDPRQSSSSSAKPNAAAYEAYTTGRRYWDQKGDANIQRAIRYFHAASELDSSFVLPDAALAEAYGFIAMWHDSRFTYAESYRQGKFYGERAIARDPTSVTAHAALAHIAFLFDHDFVNAEREYQLALRLDSTYSPVHQRYAWFLLAMGRPDESSREMARALALNEASPYTNSASALHLLCLGRFDDALRRIQATIALHPEYAAAYGELARAQEATGDYTAALAVYDKILRESRDTNIEMIAARGHSLGTAGRQEEAREALRQLETLSRERYVSPYQFAIVELGLGNRRGALQHVLKAWDDRSLWIPWLRGDPRLDPIRAEPEFQKLLQQVRTVTTPGVSAHLGNN